MPVARPALLTLAIILSASAAQASDGGPGREIVCHMTEVASGKPKGATLDPVYGPPSGKATEFHLYDFTAQGTGVLRIGDGRYGTKAFRYIRQPGALIITEPANGMGEAHFTIQDHPDGDAYPAVRTMHGWAPGDVNVSLEVGRCFKASAPL